MVNRVEVDARLDQVFTALADGSRRRIVVELAERGELSVGDASSQLDLSPAGVTKHVKVLEAAGLVSRRLDGRRHLLSLESAPLQLAEDWLDRYRTLWATSLSRLADLAEAIEAESPDGEAPDGEGER